MGLIYVLMMSDNHFKVNKHSIGQSTLCPTLYSTILSVFLFCYCNSVYRFELLFLLFVFTLFVSTMNFLGNVLFLGNMRRFQKLLSNSSSRTFSEEEAERAKEKGLWVNVHMHSNKLNNLNQRGNLDSAKHKMLFSNNRMDEITVCSYDVT